jgi:nitroreductase
MDLKRIVYKNRSYRRFDESHKIECTLLRDWIRLAQHSPSARNAQPLKFWLSNTPEMNDVIYPHLGWAGALKDWGGPAKGERPSAYILILGDTEIRETFSVDHGIAAQSILLGAVQAGYGGCMIGSVQREGVRTALGIPERFQILLAIALGKPVERVVIEPVGADGSITYYRDENSVHHVPKRSLAELIVHDV